MAHSSATFIGVTKNVDSNLVNLLQQVCLQFVFFNFLYIIHLVVIDRNSLFVFLLFAINIRGWWFYR